ncbi:MAG TPA: exodeoxyribonuclease VII small subunit [Candidatus Baltobacteraceae bacterium]|nr:exodeoxyribonuclease VII small subunit [Candidatus Baltobacteraceae bacterium]HTX56996.1 exodeoxyribonuclease VII small subunit [Candidatus Acidoferrales bacterium]
MSDKQPDNFEARLARLEEIVKQLESGEPSLDDAVKLFKEGKLLAAECEGLLKNAQEQIDAAMGDAKT